MSHKILERIKSVVAEKKITQRDFAKGMQMSVTTANKFLNVEEELSIYMIDKISEFLEINSNWVITGRGPKYLKQGDNFEESEDSDQELQKLKQRLHQLEEENQRLRNTKMEGTQGTLIRFLDAGAVHSYLQNIDNKEFIDRLPYYTKPSSRFPNKNYMTFEITGEEMNHTIVSGDWALCEKVEDISSIKDQHVYILILENEVICRRVVNRIKERGRLRLKCDNKFFRDKEIEANTVKEVWQVKSVETFSLMDPFFSVLDLVKKLEDKVYEMEERVDRVS